jgi:hypothetical protein
MLLAITGLALGQEARYVTVTAAHGATNQIQIADYETGELVSFLPTPTDTWSVFLQKDGRTFNVPGDSRYYQVGGRGTIVQGPATFLVWGANGDVMATVKIKPASFPPDKTIILPPGTNQFQVTLETSTNLVSWLSTTNGVYGSPDTARFFRIHLQQLN